MASPGIHEGAKNVSTPTSPLTIRPLYVAFWTCLTVIAVYAVVTAWWLLSGKGEPSGGWGLDVFSAVLQVAGWSLLSLLVALLLAAKNVSTRISPSTISPPRVALWTCLTVIAVYAVMTAWWLLSGKGEPSGGWGLAVFSTVLQVAGWSLLSFLVALLLVAIRRKPLS